MKIALIGPSKLRYMPYMKHYLDMLEGSGCAVHVVYWDRDGKPDEKWDSDAVFHPFREDMDDGWPHRKKAIPFLGFRRHVVRVLKETGCDKVVFFQTVTGLCVADLLVGRYSENYIYDYRDVGWTYKVPLFRRMTAKLVAHSAITFVSSDGYRDYLPPNGNIARIHNVDGRQLRESLGWKRERAGIRGRVCKVAFWGNVRNGAINDDALAAFAADERFEFHFYGAVTETKYLDRVERLLSGSKRENVFFHGPYSADERQGFAEESDLLWNCYYFGKGSYNPAVSNKYYDGLVFRIPQIVFSNSFSGREVTEKGLGISIDPSSDGFLDEIYDYWKSVDMERFDEVAEAEARSLCSEVSDARRRIVEFASSQVLPDVRG